MHEDAVAVGLPEVRSKAGRDPAPGRDLSPALALNRPVRDRRITRILGRGGPRLVQVILLSGPDRLGDQIRQGLAEAFADATSG